MTRGKQTIPFFFFFNDTATTEIYTLSLHDALPISCGRRRSRAWRGGASRRPACRADRKSTRLNSSHVRISYAVFCLKKKKKQILLCPLQVFSHRLHSASTMWNPRELYGPLY